MDESWDWATRRQIRGIRYAFQTNKHVLSPAHLLVLVYQHSGLPLTFQRVCQPSASDDGGWCTGAGLRGCVPSKTEPLIPSPPVAVLSTLVHSLTRALNILTFVPKTQVPTQFTIVHSALARPQIGISVETFRVAPHPRHFPCRSRHHHVVT